jgi:hypothetical protein
VAKQSLFREGEEFHIVVFDRTGALRWSTILPNRTQYALLRSSLIEINERTMIFDLAGKSVKDFSLDQVFMAEYVSPLFIYLLFDTRPSLIYGANASVKPMHLAAQ